MASNLDLIVENFLSEDQKPNPEMSFEDICNLIEEQMDALSVLLERTGTSQADLTDISITLPTIKITEDWGKAGSKDRAIIENFTKNIAPGGTLEQKLTALNSVLTEKKTDAKISEILSTMVVCEVLSIILREFTESAGGFIFEGFLAGLFGGKSVQITSPEEIEGMGAAGKPITDVILGGRHYSLKLLGQTTGVKGSFRNMVEHFKVIDHIVYLDARRVGGTEGLEFGEFTITLENFLDVFFTPFAKLKKKTAKAPTARTLRNAFEKFGDKIYKIQSSKRLGRKSVFTPQELDQLDNETLTAMAPFNVFYSEESFAQSTKARQLFGTGRQFNAVVDAIEAGNRDAIFAALEATEGYQKSRQFELTRKQAESISNFKHVGTLMIGEESMKRTWAAYADLLKETISPVYSYLQLFTNNINSYFLEAGEGEKSQDRKQYAMDAINDAKNLERATTTAVKSIEKES
jgi:hypothetical protein